MKRKKRNGIKKFFIILLTIGLLSILAYNLYDMYQKIEITSDYETEKTTVLSTSDEQSVDNTTENSQTIADVIEKVSKSVCGISKLTTAGGSILSTNTEEELGLGTGIVVSRNGYILSNSHVTGEKYSTCYVTIEDKDTYKGRVVWSNVDLDLSITKIDVEGLEYVTLGDSKNIRVGENVYAIGNPIGFEFRRTVTSGIISALNRTIKIEERGTVSYMSDLIQTDATINPR